VSRYVAKIIFTYILGYKVDVGHMEAVNLISSPKYTEKQIVGLLLPPEWVSLCSIDTFAGLLGRDTPHARELGFPTLGRQLHKKGSGGKQRSGQLPCATRYRERWRK
jgi:hypothetical protein